MKSASSSSASFRDRPMNAVQLVAYCVQCFGEDGESGDDEFTNAFFLSHQWLLDSLQFVTLFVNHFQESRDATAREATCCAVVHWIQHFPMHFDAQPQVCAQVVLLKTIAEGVDDDIRESLDVSNLPSFAWLRAVSVRNPVARQVSLSFEQSSPGDISSSLTHIDYRVLSRISITELKQYVKDGNLRSCPMLERSISVFNNLSNWVQCMILSKPTPKERVDVLAKFVQVAKHLRKLNNFNTLMAVVGGVSHSTILRLAKTQALLPSDVKKDLNQLTNLLSTQHNFSEYRKCLEACGNKFKIPIVGVHLKDLVAAHSAGENFDKTKTITRKRLIRLSALFSNFLAFNTKPPHVPDVNVDLVNTLKVSLDIRYNENDIYEMSLRREPKTFMNFEPSRGVVFAEWASGVSVAPDSATVTKHISAMVDAVFKHYDHDRDGYISQSEFRQIAGNFPFLDSFVDIDSDHDGQISKEELKTYFMDANNDSLALRRGFKHNFHETTFLAPTTCSHCSKLLWGLLRQGFKCKDCGLAVHSCCKANAVAECRRCTTGGCRKSSGGFSRAAEWLASPRGSVRNKFFSTCKTVSTVSTSPEPTPVSPPPCCSSTRLHLPKALRAKSETAECYKTASSITPEAEEELGLASLACEEVFDDEMSTS